MKKLSFLFLFLFSIAAHALTANAVRFTQITPDGTTFVARDVAPPSGSASGVMFFNGGNQLPQYMLLGSNLSFDSSTLSVTGLGTSSFSGSYSDLSAIPSTFPPSPHTHAQADIQGLTSTIASITSTVATKLTIPSGSTNQYVAGDGSLQTIPTSTLRSFATVTVAVNATATQVNSSRDALVNYAVDIGVTSPLLAGSQGTACLQYSDNQAMTTNLVTLICGTNSTSGVLNLTNVGTVALAGVIPAGKYRRVQTTTNSGSPTFTGRQGQEVLL